MGILPPASASSTFGAEGGLLGRQLLGIARGGLYDLGAYLSGIDVDDGDGISRLVIAYAPGVAVSPSTRGNWCCP